MYNYVSHSHYQLNLYLTFFWIHFPCFYHYAENSFSWVLDINKTSPRLSYSNSNAYLNVISFMVETHASCYWLGDNSIFLVFVLVTFSGEAKNSRWLQIWWTTVRYASHGSTKLFFKNVVRHFFDHWSFLTRLVFSGAWS